MMTMRGRDRVIWARQRELEHSADLLSVDNRSLNLKRRGNILPLKQAANVYHKFSYRIPPGLSHLCPSGISGRIYHIKGRQPSFPSPHSPCDMCSWDLDSPHLTQIVSVAIKVFKTASEVSFRMDGLTIG